MQIIATTQRGRGWWVTELQVSVLHPSGCSSCVVGREDTDTCHTCVWQRLQSDLWPAGPETGCRRATCPVLCGWIFLGVDVHLLMCPLGFLWAVCSCVLSVRALDVCFWSLCACVSSVCTALGWLVTLQKWRELLFKTSKAPPRPTPPSTLPFTPQTNPCHPPLPHCAPLTLQPARFLLFPPPFLCLTFFFFDHTTASFNPYHQPF